MPKNMPDPDYKAFFKKRGFVVKKVEQTEKGYDVYINDPDRARELYSSLPDSRHRAVRFIPTEKPKPVVPIESSGNWFKRFRKWVREKF